MVPAQERLEADDAVTVERDDGLVLDHELVRVERHAQVVLELESCHGGGVQARVVSAQAALALCLCLVHGQVGVAQEQVAIVPRRGDRVSDTGPDEDLGLPDLECGCQRVHQSTPQVVGIHLRGNVLGQNGELVATQPRDGVDGAHGAAQSLADRGEQQVARRVAKAVVDRLEVIEVQEEDGQTLAIGYPL